jgi:Lrp/AsnC family leucine-responsive transcriptional regulator
MLDATDLRILSILQDDARTSNADIARQIGLAPSATLERLRKLERGGVIRGYTVRIEPRALGQALVAFVFVRSDERVGAVRTARALAGLDGVQEVHHIAGEDCFLVKVRATDTGSLGRLLREKFGSIPMIRSTRTTIVLETVKESSALFLPGASGRSGGAARARGAKRTAGGARG